jgi:hypothetical protein
MPMCDIMSPGICGTPAIGMKYGLYLCKTRHIYIGHSRPIFEDMRSGCKKWEGGEEGAGCGTWAAGASNRRRHMRAMRSCPCSPRTSQQEELSLGQCVTINHWGMVCRACLKVEFLC